MKKIWVTILFLHMVLCGLFIGMPHYQVYAEDVETPLEYKKTEETGLYRYEFPNQKGFSTIVKQGELDAPLAMFIFDEGIRCEMLKDGQSFSYEDEQLIDQTGVYQMTLYADQEGSAKSYMAKFVFSVKSLQLFDSNGFDFGQVIDNAPLKPSYNYQLNRFDYTLPNGGVFSCTIPNGGISMEAVRVNFSQDLLVTVAKNDVLMQVQSGDLLQEPGTYSITMVQNLSLSGNSEDKNSYVAYFHFKVYNNSLNNIGIFNCPQDFIISEVKKDDKPLLYESPEYFAINEDGIYEFLLTATFDNNIQYHITLPIDTKPPLLRLTNHAMGGRAKGKVRIIPLEESALITVRSGGNEIELLDNELTEPGRYIIYVRDLGGNTMSYSFLLEPGLKFLDTKSVVILVIFIVAVVIHMIYSRRNMRVL